MTGKKKDQCNINPDRQWGGKREGGGFPAKWRNGNSKPLRIPEALHEAVIAYAHALEDGTPFPPGNGDTQPEPQGIIHPTGETDTLTAEDIRQMQLTVEAFRSILERWREELRKHNPKQPRWEKVNQLFDELEAHLHTPWL